MADRSECVFCAETAERVEHRGLTMDLCPDCRYQVVEMTPRVFRSACWSMLVCHMLGPVTDGLRALKGGG